MITVTDNRKPIGHATVVFYNRQMYLIEKDHGIIKPSSHGKNFKVDILSKRYHDIRYEVRHNNGETIDLVVDPFSRRIIPRIFYNSNLKKKELTNKDIMNYHTQIVNRYNLDRLRSGATIPASFEDVCTTNTAFFSAYMLPFKYRQALNMWMWCMELFDDTRDKYYHRIMVAGYKEIEVIG